MWRDGIRKGRPYKKHSKKKGASVLKNVTSSRMSAFFPTLRAEILEKVKKFGHL
jgi:hypothetical protein